MSGATRKIRRLINSFFGRDIYPLTQCRCNHQRYGTDYGGWDVVTNIIDESSIVYSFGVGEDASFDIALIDAYGLVVHAFDPTPRSIQWVCENNLPEKFIFHNYGIAGIDGRVLFSPPVNSDHVSHSIVRGTSTNGKAFYVPVKRLHTIMSELGHNNIDLLKMDIEGAEYQVIQDLMDTNVRPSQLLVEFHHRLPNVGVARTKEALRQIRKMNYLLFSVSSTAEELCFIHKNVM